MLGDAWEGVRWLIGTVLPSHCGMLMLEGGTLWLHSFPITEVNLTLSCPERAVSNQILILQSWANITWSLSVNNCHIQFLVGLSGTCMCVCVHEGMPVARGGWH